MTDDTPRTIDTALTLTRLAGQRKILRPVLLDVSRLTSYTDFILIVGAGSTRQVAAVAEHVVTEAKKKGVRPIGREGGRDSQWTLLDFGEVIVHVFFEPLRRHYDIEGLFAEADRVDLQGVIPQNGLDQNPVLEYDYEY